MVRVCQLNIKETGEELHTLLNQQKTAIGFQKVQTLYLFKTGQLKTIKDIAVAIGSHRVTVQNWLHKYRQAGILGLLEVRHGGGRQKIIPPEAIAVLEERLKDPNNGFKSYGEIHKWLQEFYGVKVDYKTVYATVRYQLKAKLKVPRRQSVKKDSQLAIYFKKNCLSSSKSFNG
ncbi:MAG: helix-turn-helix domain-containing protein [Brasilonema octagenarum HA4186-MV1]|jgi:transposase|nr:helix-turn-helix domain-containing protein [Brasilonema octagenarum HA4186-MV1]